MISDEIRGKLQDIVRGVGYQEPGDLISEIRNLLVEGFGAGRTSQKDFERKSVAKKEQEQFLRQFCINRELYLPAIPVDINYLAQGGEATVYLTGDGLHVIKVNNGRYYATWTEFLTSLLLHNILFPSTKYTVLGFHDPSEAPPEESSFAIVLQQKHIEGEQIQLLEIENILRYNEFELLKRQDYFNREFRILLEDMHDENVIKSEGFPFFIDTVFYILESQGK